MRKGNIRYKEDKDDARDFYLENRDEMEAGAEVLWPNVQPLYALMEEWATNPKAFNAELQNEPLDEDSRIFRVEQGCFWHVLPPGLIKVGAIDPALGKTRGDYTAIVVVGRDPKTNKIYEIESRIARIPPQRAIREVIAMQVRHSCVRWGVEAVAFQEFFRQALIEAGLKDGVPIPASAVNSRVNKEVRIEGLAPYIENGTLLLNPDSHLLIDQLNYYPMADNDDGPDALEMAFRLAYREAPIEYRKTPLSRGRWGRGF